MPQEDVNAPIPNVARIVVTFEAADEGPFPEGDAPQVFWRYVRRQLGIGDDENIRERDLERRVVQQFGLHLRDLLATDFRTGGHSEYRRRRKFPGEFIVERSAVPLPAFAFQVTGFRYGSLSLDIDVAGLKGLAEFFDKNLDLLKIVLCQYAPNALAMAANGGGGSIRGLTCSFQSSPELERAFAPPPSPSPGTPATPTADPGSSKKLEALNWAWIVSNTSLLIPVALCLVIMYFSFVGIEHERDRLSQAMSSLADKQTEMMKVLAAIAQQQKPSADAVPKLPSPTKP